MPEGRRQPGANPHTLVRPPEPGNFTQAAGLGSVGTGPTQWGRQQLCPLE